MMPSSIKMPPPDELSTDLDRSFVACPSLCPWRASGGVAAALEAFLAFLEAYSSFVFAAQSKVGCVFCR